MRYFFRLLTCAILSLTMSSCKGAWAIYRSQENIPAPSHVLEANNEYETLWNRSDIHVAGGSDTPRIVGSPNKVIIMGWRKDSVLDASILGINSENGDVLWEVPGFSGDIVTSNNGIYVGTYGTATVHSLNIENGESLWSTRLPGAHSTSNIYFAEEKIFVHTNDSEFFVLNQQGEIFDNFRETFRTFLELDGVLYTENVLGIKAIELSSKEELWSLDIGERYTHPPIFDGGEMFLRTWNYSANIYSIDQYTGEINWTTSQDIQSNLCLANDKIYFTNPAGYLVAINRTTGDEVSRVKFSLQFDLDKQISDYYVACDATSNVIVVSFGDNTQIMGLRIINP